jgi:hypothetical protein
MKNKEYKHFLRYDQAIFDDIMHGSTDLYYDTNDSTLFIMKVQPQKKSAEELEFPIPDKNSSIQIVLENFLINLLSFRGNFVGTPEYESSDLFSKESFDKMLKQAYNLMDERDELVRLAGANNEMIKYCESAGLNPQPAGNSPTNWHANCPSGGQHYVMISVKSNEWGCGYCRKKGDLDALKKWIESKKN